MTTSFPRSTSSTLYFISNSWSFDTRHERVLGMAGFIWIFHHLHLLQVLHRPTFLLHVTPPVLLVRDSHLNGSSSRVWHCCWTCERTALPSFLVVSVSPCLSCRVCCCCSVLVFVSIANFSLVSLCTSLCLSLFLAVTLWLSVLLSLFRSLSLVFSYSLCCR